jgi:hypothetical protein
LKRPGNRAPKVRGVTAVPTSECGTFAARFLASYTQCMRPAGFRWTPFVLPLLCLTVLSSCSDLTTVSFDTQALEFSVTASSLEVPVALQDGGRVAELACPAGGSCPSSEAMPVTCERSLCDPAPRTVTAPVGDVIDFDELTGDLSGLFREVDAIQLSELTYTVQLNTLSVDLEAIEIYWGPEGAVDIDPALGVERLATIPSQQARITSSGKADVDPSGSQALSDYLVGSSRRIRLFVRTEVDLEPGGELPEGELSVVAQMTVNVSGPMIIE